MAEGRAFHVVSRPNGKNRCRMSGLVAGRGLTTERHGKVSLDVGGGFWGGWAQGWSGAVWGGRAQGQQVAACLSAGPDRKCSAA